MILASNSVGVGSSLVPEVKSITFVVKIRISSICEEIF